MMNKAYKITINHYLNKLLPNAAGKFPVYLRVIYKRRSTKLSSGISGHFSDISEVDKMSIVAEQNQIIASLTKYPDADIQTLKGFFTRISAAHRKAVAIDFIEWLSKNKKEYMNKTIEETVDSYVQEHENSKQQ